MGSWGNGKFESDEEHEAACEVYKARDPAALMQQRFEEFLRGTRDGYDQSEWGDVVCRAKEIFGLCEVARLAAISIQDWPGSTPVDVSEWLAASGFRSSATLIVLAERSIDVMLGSRYIREVHPDFWDPTLQEMRIALAGLSQRSSSGT